MTKEGEHDGLFTVERIHLLPGDSGYAEIAEAVARCYQRTFGTSPAWHEGWMCPASGQEGTCPVYGLEDGNRPGECHDHHLPLVLFWPVEKVMRDMQAELSRVGAVWAAAHINGAVVGATWGFPMTAEELEEHLGKPGFAVTLAREFHDQQKFLYCDEIFVDPEHQGQGIATQLFYERLIGLVESTSQAQACILRTKRGHGEQAAKTYNWYTSDKLGFRVVAEYGDERDRVVLGQFVNQIPARHRRVA